MNKPVPENWKYVKFGEVVKQVKDRFPNRDEWTFDRFINGGHIDSGQTRITKSSPIKGNEETIGSAFHMRFKPGHVLYVSRRAYLRKGGIVDFEGICSNVTFVLQADETKLLQSLLPFIIQTEAFVKHAVDNSHGSTNPFLNWKDIASYKMLLPPLEKQKKISELLWSIEDNIQKNEKLIETTEKLKHGLLNELLTKGIGHTRFKDSELGRIPEEWEVIRLGDITEMSQYGLSLPLKEEGEYPILKMDNLVNGLVNVNGLKYVDIDEDTFEKFRLQKGDILFNRTNSYEHVGRTSIFTLDENYVFASYIIRLKIVEDLADPYFITKYLIHYNYDIKKIATKSIQQANINSKNLSNYKIRLPNLNEQKEIVSILNNIEQRLQSQKEHINKLESLKKKLINEFLSGNLKAERDLEKQKVRVFIESRL